MRPPLAPLALLALAAGLAAAEPFVVVEQRLLRPSVADPDFTVLSNASSGIDEGERRALDYDAARSTAIRLGLVFGGGDRVEFAGWLDTQSRESIVQADQNQGSVSDALYPASQALGQYQNGTAHALGALRAWTMDLDYAHPFSLAESPWSFEATFGLRRAGLRDDFAVEYSGGGNATRRVENLSDAIGNGARVGVAVRRGFFGSRVGVGAGVGYALLRGTVTTASSAARLGNTIDQQEHGSETAGFAMLDLSVGADAQLGAGFALSAWYRLERWDGMLRSDRFTTAANAAMRSVDRPSATWDGYVIALGWTSRR